MKPSQGNGRYMKTSSRLSRMMQRLNIDANRGLDLNMPIISRAAVVCETCLNPEECASGLYGGKHGRGTRQLYPNATPSH